MPAGVEPEAVAKWLQPAAGRALHYEIRGAPGVTMLPYFEVGSGDDEPLFTNYPAFV